MSKSHNPILTNWLSVVNEKGKSPALYDVDGTVLRSFDDIEREAVAFASRLNHLKDGAVVGLQTGNCPEWPAILLACWRRGCTVLPMESTMADAESAEALQQCGAAVWITRRNFQVKIESLDHPVPTWSGQQPDLLKLTSGTTSAARVICFQADQLVADAENVCSSMGISAADINFGVIPFSHSYGFSNLITPCLCFGVPLVVSADRMPRAILDGLEQSGATIFPGIPVFFQMFTQMSALPALTNIRTFISAGAPLCGEVAQVFFAQFGRKIHSFLGSSECGGICYDRSDDPNVPAGFVGEALDRVTVTALGDWATPGGTRIAVTSSAVGDCYFPEADPETLSNRRFVPNDLVTQVADPQGLQIIGRASDIINVAGKKLNPLTVEALLSRHPAVREVVVFATDSTLRNKQVIACIVLAQPETAAALLHYCRETLSSWQVPRDIWFVDRIPANERGKVSRRELAARYRKR